MLGIQAELSRTSFLRIWFVFGSNFPQQGNDENNPVIPGLGTGCKSGLDLAAFRFFAKLASVSIQEKVARDGLS